MIDTNKHSRFLLGDCLPCTFEKLLLKALNINLDKTSNYLVITANKPIKDFKINAIEYTSQNK